MIRKIVEINQERCNGCGACANACHENAIAMINGKATLIKDDYCDGFGDCLPACPADAITIIEREAAAYDEEEVRRRQQLMREAHHAGGGCPGSMGRSIAKKPASAPAVSAPYAAPTSQLTSWPVQIKLLPLNAPYFDGANLLIAADCTAYAYAAFHEEFIKNRVPLIGCPKLDDMDYSIKLTEILKNNDIKSVTIVRMEVPCCGGLQHAAVTALQNCGKMIPWQVVTIGIDGEKR